MLVFVHPPAMPPVPPPVMPPVPPVVPPVAADRRCRRRSCRRLPPVVPPVAAARRTAGAGPAALAAARRAALATSGGPALRATRVAGTGAVACAGAAAATVVATACRTGDETNGRERGQPEESRTGTAISLPSHAAAPLLRGFKRCSVLNAPTALYPKGSGIQPKKRITTRRVRPVAGPANTGVPRCYPRFSRALGIALRF